MGSHSLKHGRGCRKAVDIGRHGDELPRRHNGIFRVGPRLHRIGNAVADFDLRDIRAGGIDQTGCFPPEGERQRQRVETGALIDVDVVEADGFDLDARFTGLGFRDRNLFVFENFRSAKNCVRVRLS